MRRPFLSAARPWRTAMLAGCVFLLASPAALGGQEVSGQGRAFAADVVIVRGAKVRLTGYAIPKADQTCAGAGSRVPCLDAALDGLGQLLESGPVTCKLEKKVGHGSYQGTCRLADGSDLGRAMVARGWVRAGASAGDHYTHAEAATRAARRGIWSRGN